MHLKMLSGKWRPFCLELNVLTLQHVWPTSINTSPELNSFIKRHPLYSNHQQTMGCLFWAFYLLKTQHISSSWANLGYLMHRRRPPISNLYGQVMGCSLWWSYCSMSDPHLWTQALAYFARKEENCKTQIMEVLTHIDRWNLLPPLLVIQTLAHNSTATLAVVKVSSLWLTHSMHNWLNTHKVSAWNSHK